MKREKAEQVERLKEELKYKEEQRRHVNAETQQRV